MLELGELRRARGRSTGPPTQRRSALVLARSRRRATNSESPRECSVPTNNDKSGLVVLIFGPTGTAGSGVLKACLNDPAVSEVRAVTRRPIAQSHPKLAEVMCSDFADFSEIASSFRGVDLCLFCLGISARNVSGEDQYREIHVTYPVAAASTLSVESPEASFVYLSGAGAKRCSKIMWARVKAEAEDRLSALGLKRQLSFRPGFIVPTHAKGLTRFVLAPLVDAIPALGVSAYDLGRAMLRVAVPGGAAVEGAILENREIRRVLAR